MTVMQRTDFGDMACSIARTLHIAGEPWSLLIVRNAMVDIMRFEDHQRALGISRKVLAERLGWLVEQGIFERRLYSERPPRHEYVLTEKGRELADILFAISAWGDRWTATEAGPPALFRHRICGELTHAEIRCAHCGEPLHSQDIEVTPGPGAEPLPAEATG
jgi:DNA-binding HxlR family transcriptional regulator